MSRFESDYYADAEADIAVSPSCYDGLVLIETLGRAIRFTPATARLFGQAVIDTASTVEAKTAVTLIDGLKALLTTSSTDQIEAALADIYAESKATAADPMACCKHCPAHHAESPGDHSLPCGERYSCPANR